MKNKLIKYKDIWLYIVYEHNIDESTNCNDIIIQDIFIGSDSIYDLICDDYKNEIIELL